MNIARLLDVQNPWWAERRRGIRALPSRRPQFSRVMEMLDAGEPGIVLVGPRRIGKTELLRQVIEALLSRRCPDGEWTLSPKNVVYFDFDDDRILPDLSPDDVLDAVEEGLRPGEPAFFLFDEIARYPRWDRWLKRTVDASRRMHSAPERRFVVTDSAANLLTDGRRESGLGRWRDVLMEGWTYREFLSLHSVRGEPPDTFHSQRTFERYLAIGGFPAQLSSMSEDLDRLRSDLREQVIEKALYKDMSRHGVDVDQLRRLLLLLVGDSGAEQSVAARASDLGANRKSVEKWTELLASAHLITRLERLPVSNRAAERLRVATKWYASDHGLVTALGTGEDRPAWRARVFETLVHRHLREVVDDPRESISYFRDKKGRECDFVLELAGTRVALEVTSSTRVRPDKAQRTLEASRAIGADRTFVIHAGDGTVERDGVCRLALASFLLDPGLVTHSPEEPEDAR